MSLEKGKISRWLRCIILVLLAVAPRAWLVALDVAVEVKLVNGDTLSGALLREDDKAIGLRSPFLGDVSIAREAIATIARVAPPPAAAQALKANAFSPAFSAEVAQANPGRESSEPAVSFAQKLRATFSLDDWNKRLEFGMSTQSGRRDREDFNFRYKMQRKQKANEHRLLARYFYGESNGSKSTDKARASFRWRRDLSSAFFQETDTAYSFDAIKRIDMDLEQRLGLGYRLLETDRAQLTAGTGASGRLRDDFSKDNEFEYLMDVVQDWDFRVNKQLKLAQEFRVAMPIEGSEHYQLDFSAAMISELTDNLALTLRYILEYDNSLSRDNREFQRFISSIGLDF